MAIRAYQHVPCVHGYVHVPQLPDHDYVHEHERPHDHENAEHRQYWTRDDSRIERLELSIWLLMW